MTKLTRKFGIGLAAILVAAPSRAQEIPQTQPDSATVRANKKLFNERDLAMLGAWTAATIALTPLDKHFAQELQDSSVQANHFLKNASHGVEVIATPGAYYIGGSLYLVGRL